MRLTRAEELLDEQKMQRYAETGPEEGSFETETVDLIGPAEDIEVSTENITGEQEDYRRTLHIIKETMICHYDETTDVHDRRG